ncbi:MAG: transcription initiation factor IIB [Piptocephalis tieghemiana]|nr:MAG: transcription initiation factor IIB [Piptocephalis tieghemiana]
MDNNFRILSSVKHPPLPNLNIRLICKFCRRDPPNLVENFSDGDIVCGDCGLVLGDRIIDTRSEWRTFSNEDDDPSRVGGSANPLLDGSQLDTIISKRDGNSGSSRNLSKTHGRASANKGERQLVQGYKQIAALCEAIQLPKRMSDAAKELYKRVEKEQYLKGKSNDAAIGACIYIACRQDAVPRTFKEIAALTKVPKRDLGRCFKLLQQHLGEHIQGTSGSDLMFRFCSKLKLSTQVRNAAVAISERAIELGTLAGKSPVSIAAACIYMASGLLRDPRDTREIALVAGVSEVTIRNAYRSLYASKDSFSSVIQGAGHMDSLPTP